MQFDHPRRDVLSRDQLPNKNASGEKDNAQFASMEYGTTWSVLCGFGPLSVSVRTG